MIKLYHGHYTILDTLVLYMYMLILHIISMLLTFCHHGDETMLIIMCWLSLWWWLLLFFIIVILARSWSWRSWARPSRSWWSCRRSARLPLRVVCVYIHTYVNKQIHTYDYELTTNMHMTIHINQSVKMRETFEELVRLPTVSPPPHRIPAIINATSTTIIVTNINIRMMIIIIIIIIIISSSIISTMSIS